MARRSLHTPRNEGYRDVFIGFSRELPRFAWKTVRVNPDDVALSREQFPEAEVLADPAIIGMMVAVSEGDRVRVVNTFEKRLEKPLGGDAARHHEGSGGAGTMNRTARIGLGVDRARTEGPQGLLRRERTQGYPTEYLLSRIRGRRSRLIRDWRPLIYDASPLEHLASALYQGFVRERTPEGMWRALLLEQLKTRAFEEAIRRDELKFLAWAPIVGVSARTGRGVPGLFTAARRVAASWRQRVTTGQLNRVLARAAQEYAPKAAKGSKPVAILYAAQVGTAPPTFLISLNHPVDLHFSYKRYLENRLRAEFGFEGSPIRLKARARAH